MSFEPTEQSAFAGGRDALVRFGWSEPLEAAFEALPDSGLVAARVAGAQREVYTLWSTHGVLAAALSGKFRHAAEHGELPVVGDWVAVRQESGDRATIHERLPRRTELAR